MKQETTKEAAERMSTRVMEILFKDEKKLQQERSYSEEEMRECYEFAIENVQLGRNGYEWITFDEWFEQFKKK